MLQGSPEWRQARCGSLGASSLYEAVAKTKTGWGASRANLMARLIAERLTEIPQDSYTNGAMAHGIETEPEARAAYSFMRDVDVTEIGIVLHPRVRGSHASPDGLVGDDGLVEIKCPNTATHIETLLTGSVADKYVIQMQWQIACTGRQWCDFVSYDYRMPEEMQLFVRRFERDNERIQELEELASGFIGEMEAKIRKLKGLRALSQTGEAA
jgi:putative phage-type endonuclease